uniref:Uncharacterized protein n=1 Tax=Rhizophora mucronata TaxID=61149 RepID=A0A2P2Q249_RHIMU
MFLPTGKEYAF